MYKVDEHRKTNSWTKQTEKLIKNKTMAQQRYDVISIFKVVAAAAQVYFRFQNFARLQIYLWPTVTLTFDPLTPKWPVSRPCGIRGGTWWTLIVTVQVIDERRDVVETVLRLSGRYLTWCFICWTTFSLSDNPSDVHVALVSSCCRLSVLSDVTSGRDDVTVVSRFSSSQSDVLVPVDSRLNTHHTPADNGLAVIS